MTEINSGSLSEIRVTRETMPKHRLNDSAREDIRLNYEHNSAKHFAEKYDVAIATVYGVANALGVTSNQRWDTYRGVMVAEYEAGGKLNDIARKYGHFPGNLRKRLEGWGVEIRSMSDAKRLYDFDRTFFAAIDTAEKAYWLGFIYADGNVYQTPNKRVFQVCLAGKDWTHVEALKAAMKSEHPLYDDNGNARFMINDIELVAQLGRLGVGPRKSLCLEFPSTEQVPEHLISHFIRGYFDGDGWLSLSSNGRRWMFGIISTAPFLRQIQVRLKEGGLSVTKLNPEKRTGNGAIFSIVFSGYLPKKKQRDIKTCRLLMLYRYLYSGGGPALQRKKAAFENTLRQLYRNDWI